MFEQLQCELPFDVNHEAQSNTASSDAASFNERVLRKLLSEFRANPELDLLGAFPSNYQSRLEKRKQPSRVVLKHGTQSSSPILPVSSTANLQQCAPSANLDAKEPAVCLHAMSLELQDLLRSHMKPSDRSAELEADAALTIALQELKIIWQPSDQTLRSVGMLRDRIAVKIRQNNQEFTEYTTLRYLEQHHPEVPAPRPHGLIVKGQRAYLFMSLVPGSTLSDLWPSLSTAQKSDLSVQLSQIFTQLRTIERPEHVPLGGTSGEGCKDIRRHVRRCDHAIFSNQDYWQFQYLSRPTGSEVYIEFLRRLTVEMQSKKCVFTHGDLRPENIMVEACLDGRYVISGIIDWEMSGYYPEDQECISSTNNLTPREKCDWILYLPTCISPVRYPSRWLADRVWDAQVA